MGILDDVKDTAINGGVAGLGITVYDRVARRPLVGFLGPFLGGFADVGASLLAGILAKRIGAMAGREDLGVVAAAGIFGVTIAKRFLGFTDPPEAPGNGGDFTRLAPVPLRAVVA
jgi:hypothetical protein